MPGAPNTYTVTALVEDHPPVKELPSGLPDLIPGPAHGPKHGSHDAHGCATCGEEHEIDGFMTPFVPNHGGWYLGGEFLLMKARSTDLDYVISGQNPGLATVGPIQSLKYDLGTGFRVEGGYRFGEHGRWEIGSAYTYFTSNEETTGASGTLFPTLTRPGLTDRATSARALADIDYNVYDALVSRRVLLDEHFGVRFIGGLRFADIRQTFNAFYDGGDARLAAVTTRSQFQGVGPIFGTEAVLAGWKGFHIYGRAIGGLISGRSANQLIETNDNGATTYVNTSYDVRKVVPMTNLAIGLGWQYRTFSIRAGYEIAYWQGIFERPRFVDDVSQGKVITRPANLSLEGLFIQCGLSF
jgi:hypothetical protein